MKMNVRIVGMPVIGVVCTTGVSLVAKSSGSCAGEVR